MALPLIAWQLPGSPHWVRQGIATPPACLSRELWGLEGWWGLCEPSQQSHNRKAAANNGPSAGEVLLVPSQNGECHRAHLWELLSQAPCTLRQVTFPSLSPQLKRPEKCHPIVIPWFQEMSPGHRGLCLSPALERAKFKTQSHRHARLIRCER